MAQDINSVIVIGNLTRDLGSDPNGRDFGYTQGGMCIATFSIANNRNRKNADGTWGSETSYFDIKLFGKTAENLKPYLTKGQKIAVNGVLKQERWQNKDGTNQSKIVIYASEVELVGGKREENRQSEFAQQYNNQQNPFRQSSPEFKPAPHPTIEQGGFQEDLPYQEEEIPF